MAGGCGLLGQEKSSRYPAGVTGYIGWPALNIKKQFWGEMTHEDAILHSNPGALRFHDSEGTWGCWFECWHADNHGLKYQWWCKHTFLHHLPLENKPGTSSPASHSSFPFPPDSFSPPCTKKVKTSDVRKGLEKQWISDILRSKTCFLILEYLVVLNQDTISKEESKLIFIKILLSINCKKKVWVDLYSSARVSEIKCILKWNHHVHVFHNMMVLNGLFTLNESRHKNHSLLLSLPGCQTHHCVAVEMVGSRKWNSRE